jgi:methionyl-tRNA synthetase
MSKSIVNAADSKPNFVKRLVTAALPYANGPIHIGHLVGYMQADFWVRWNRMTGRDCIYICGDDTHGTPIMIKARELGITPEQLIAKSQAEHFQDFSDFGIRFDHYSSTNTEENRKLAEEFYIKMRDAGHTVVKPREQLWCNHDKMFLPDRFVKGTCPKCGTPEQYGDSCDKCGSTYAATDLKNPGCALCGSAPALKASDTIAFKLSNFQSFLADWVPSHAPEEVANKLGEWIDSELLDWDISRDAPYFGFKIPGTTDKYFYVWLDAPIGYISSSEQWCNSPAGKLGGYTVDDYWKPTEAGGKPAEIYHFIGKDIIKFHLLFWPAMLKTAGRKLPTEVFVNGFLTVNGEKMSKSKGTFVSARTYLNHLDSSYLRYYFASKLNSALQDIDLGLDDFVNRVNSDLVGKITNLGSRGAQMLGKRLGSELSKSLDSDGEALLTKKVRPLLPEIADFYEKRDFAKVLGVLREIADETNKYFDEKAPWAMIKTDEAQTRQVLTTTLNAFRLIAISLKPILPEYADKVATLLNELPYVWADTAKTLLGTKIGDYQHLATRIEPAKVEAMIEATKKENEKVGESRKASTTESGPQTATNANANAKGKTMPETSSKSIATDATFLDIDTFNKVDLRIGKIVKAESVPEADKLLKLQIDLGPLGTRQIFAGIKSAYDPATLEGRLTVVVANLAPRKMKFGLSEGMVLAASDPTDGAGKGLFILSPDAGAKPGDRVK